MGACTSAKSRADKTDAHLPAPLSKAEHTEHPIHDQSLPDLPVIYLEASPDGMALHPLKPLCRTSTHNLLKQLPAKKDGDTKGPDGDDSVSSLVSPRSSFQLRGRGHSTLDLMSQSKLQEVIGEDLEAPVSTEHTSQTDANAIRCLDGRCTLNVPGSGYDLEVAWVSQSGFAPHNPGQPSEDAFAITDCISGNPNRHVISVFDGHGICGEKVADHLRSNIRPAAEVSHQASCATKRALSTFSHLSASLQKPSATGIWHAAQSSGSTCISVFVDHDVLTVANLGDSRAVLGCIQDGQVQAKDLSTDQTPYRADERNRLAQVGASVRSTGQMLGEISSNVNSWEDDQGGNDPPRVWYVDNNLSSRRGVAFTRSFGDLIAQDVCGIIDQPEILERKIQATDRYILLASDGVYDHLSSQRCMEVLHQHDDLQSGCHALVQLAYREWVQNSGRSDDITAVVVRIEGFEEKIHETTAVIDAPTPMPQVDAGECGSNIITEA